MAAFGFSIGDIILISQLSYALYETITSGRQKATRDLEELKQVLFGLHCALDHLKNNANEIATTQALSTLADGNEREMQQALDRMIENCATTLTDLETVTAKYREGARPRDRDVDGTEPESGLGRRERVKRRLASNLALIKWDMSKDELRSYRDKLQTHADSINLVLSTFNWYALPLSGQLGAQTRLTSSS
jgi:hypothetical protein